MKNIGTIDRLLRVALVIAVAAACYLGAISGVVATILIAVAVILLLTSAISFCPLYRLLGISSAPKG
jgi:hypothetical protein